MRAFAILSLTAALVAAPAFADPQGKGETASPNTLSTAAAADARVSTAPSSNKGWIDKLSLSKEAERPVLPLAPIESDQLQLAWRPGGKWGITLDLTNREPNEILPREELAAGAYYQLTPRFRLGGGLTLNGDSLSSAAQGWKQKEGEAGVRIESAFSF